MSKSLAKIYGFKFFDDLILIYPFYVIMFGEFGISSIQIGILLAVWSVTSFLLEVPSGVIADKYSRKHILFFAQIVRAAGYACWLFFPSFTGFLIGFILWGIKSAFTSGTFQALTYDLLKEQGIQSSYAKIMGKTKSLSFLAQVLAAGGAALAIHLGYSFVLMMSILAVVVAATFIILVPSPQKAGSTEEKQYFSLLKSGLLTVFSSSLILRLILFVSIAYSIGGALDEYFPIFASLTSIPAYGIALFLGFMNGAEALASLYAYRYEKVSRRWLYVLVTLTGIMLVIAAIFMNIGSLLLLALYAALFEIVILVSEAKLQHSIPSETRATITSVQGFFVEIGVIAVYFGFGALAKLYDYRESFMFFGLLVISVGIIYLINSFLRSSTQGRGSSPVPEPRF